MISPVFLLLSCALLTPKEVEALTDADGDGAASAAYRGDDCDDADPDVHPGAEEIWYDGIDQDCDGNDTDQDGDGHASAASEGDDCWDDPTAIPDDSQALVGTLQPDASDVHPGAAEVWYDGVDEDCAGGSDFDQDGDGHDADASQVAWANGDDCDDTASAVYPGAVDPWYSGADEDCGGEDDFDQDGDGYPVEEDCDDTDPAINPGVADDVWYDGVDADCDGNEADQDGDGALGEAVGGDDCDDADPTVYPGADEVWYDGIDTDCGGEDDYDQDGDGYRSDSALDDEGALGDDCDDEDPDVHPGAVDLWYDGIDADCTGNADDDQDGDGFGTSEGDCDDLDAAVSPGAVEDCGSAADDDCTGTTNDDGALGCTVSYADADGDGFGDTASACLCVEVAPYTAAAADDCDDAHANAHPGATETCADAYDNDCDGDANDLDATGCTTRYYDADADGSGTTVSECRCEPDGVYDATTGDDCADDDPTVSPSAIERCATEYDDNCDGDANPLDAPGCTVRYLDTDGDGYGMALSECRCIAEGAFTASNRDDCDDGTATVNPAATESCATPDDDNCDGDSNDPGASSCTTRYYDADGDGYGTAAADCRCAASGLYTAVVATDCDDAHATANPAATETCADSYDNDCDGDVNNLDAIGCSTRYTDVDGDGFGTTPTECRCEAAGSVTAWSSTDCDDARAMVNPAATEACSTSYDDDCSGSTNDADATGCTTRYTDSDRDGYGTAPSECRCTAVGDLTATLATDCDDSDGAVSPGAAETCATAYDDDCDGDTSDVGTPSCTTWYYDADGDGYGTSASQCTCGPSGPYSAAVSTDCDDTRSGVHPAATEICSTSYDDDCDGSSDDIGSTGCITRYTDADGDTYGTTPSECRCTASGSITATVNSDCDDTRSTVNPVATETCSTAYDDDCDGSANDLSAVSCTTRYTDADRDTYGTTPSECRCTASGSVDANNSSDCDDTRSAVKPGATETCATAYDDDCDGDSNELSAASCTTRYTDADRDSYGTTPSECRCAASGSVDATNSSDCDDTRSAVKPGATETCSTSYDDDCDGDSNEVAATGCTTRYTDSDRDTYGTTPSECRCSASGSITATVNTDCDDTRSSVNPGATETCSTAYDDDCDADINDVGATSCTTRYTDTDGDGWGSTPSECRCNASGSITATSSGDCDETDVYVHPSATETCDGKDNDCTGSLSETNLVTQTSGATKTNLGWSTSSSTVTAWTATAAVSIRICPNAGADVYYVNIDNGGFGLTLTGDSADPPILDGGGVSAVFKSTGGTSTASDLIFENGGGFLTTNRYGGNIYVSTSASGTAKELTLTNCSIIDNGGTVDFGGGIAIRNDANVSFVNVTVDGNTATNGGGIYLNGATSSLTITNSVVTNNTATTGGGAYVSSTASGSTTILSVTTSDWGTAGTENTLYDLLLDRTSDRTFSAYGLGATFSCTGGSSGDCTPSSSP